MAERLAPIVNQMSRPFADAAAGGWLRLPYCVETGRCFWPPSPSSPFVAGGAIAWRDTAAEGIVRSIVTYRRAFQHALADRVPYGVALVEVAPEVRLLAHVPHPETGPAAGDSVRLAFTPLREGEPPILVLAPSPLAGA